MPKGQKPITGDETLINHTMSIKPTGHLEIDNTYILDRVLNGTAHHASFNNHIIRSKWNYQFSRALSLRAIVQYNGLLANPTYSSLHTTRNLNFDFLITYLIHPGTAIYVGYNSNLENLIPGLCVPPPRITSGMRSQWEWTGPQQPLHQRWPHILRKGQLSFPSLKSPLSHKKTHTLSRLSLRPLRSLDASPSSRPQ